MTVINISRHNEIDTPPVLLSYSCYYMSEKEAISLLVLCVINKIVTSHVETEMCV